MSHRSRLLLLDLNDEGVKEFFIEIAKEVKLQTMEDMGFVYAPDLGYINKDGVYGSEIAARVLGIYGKSWNQMLTKAIKDGLPVRRMPGGNQFKVSECLEYRESKRYVAPKGR